jgi:hypothetical protein
MILVYLLACIGLVALILLAGLFLTVMALYARDQGEPEDTFDLAASAVSNIQAGAWQAIQELRGATNREE